MVAVSGFPKFRPLAPRAKGGHQTLGLDPQFGPNFSGSPNWQNSLPIFFFKNGCQMWSVQKPNKFSQKRNWILPLRLFWELGRLCLLQWFKVSKKSFQNGGVMWISFQPVEWCSGTSHFYILLQVALVEFLCPKDGFQQLKKRKKKPLKSFAMGQCHIIPIGGYSLLELGISAWTPTETPKHREAQARIWRELFDSWPCNLEKRQPNGTLVGCAKNWWAKFTESSWHKWTMDMTNSKKDGNSENKKASLRQRTTLRPAPLAKFEGAEWFQLQ